MENKKQKSLNLNIRVEPSLLVRIKDCCKKMYDVKISSFVRYAIEKYCKEIEER